jgi:hypothetical protein
VPALSSAALRAAARAWERVRAARPGSRLHPVRQRSLARLPRTAAVTQPPATSAGARGRAVHHGARARQHAYDLRCRHRQPAVGATAGERVPRPPRRAGSCPPAGGDQRRGEAHERTAAGCSNRGSASKHYHPGALELRQDPQRAAKPRAASCCLSTTPPVLVPRGRGPRASRRSRSLRRLGDDEASDSTASPFRRGSCWRGRRRRRPSLRKLLPPKRRITCRLRSGRAEHASLSNGRQCADAVRCSSFGLDRPAVVGGHEQAERRAGKFEGGREVLGTPGCASGRWAYD